MLYFQLIVESTRKIFWSKDNSHKLIYTYMYTGRSWDELFLGCVSFINLQVCVEGMVESN